MSGTAPGGRAGAPAATRFRRRSQTTTAAVLAAALLFGACSSSDDGASSGSPSAESSGDGDADQGDADSGVQVAETPSGATGVSFELQVIDPEPPSGDGCCLDVLTAGDVDGDGDDDVIVGAENADGVSWYRNPGERVDSAWERFVIGAGSFTTDGHAADVDQDGDLDVVISSIDRNIVEWWEQVGDPTTTEGWQRHDIGPDFAHDLVLADIDGDGRVDVGAYHTTVARVAWYRHPDDPSGPWEQRDVDQVEGEGITAADLDSDGDVDLVAGPAIYSNDDGAGTAWTRSELGGDLPSQTRSRVADVDEDGVLDIVIVATETDGRLALLRGPDWTETVIDPDAGFTHSLEIGDVDQDGHLDLLAGVMHFASEPVVRVLFGDGGTTWEEVVLSTSGTHNARFVDLDGDGHLDVVGKNFDGPKQVEVWWAEVGAASAGASRPNADPSATSPLDGFTHVEVDSSRERFNDATAFFGVAFTDVDGDGDDDIASGRYVYANPGADMTQPWQRTDLAEQIGTTVDVMLAPDVDGDDQADLIATALPDVWWLEASADGTWSGRVVSQVPATSRPNGQGYRLGDLTGDGRPEIVLAGGASESEVWYVQIPDDPEAAEWPSVRITSLATDEQIGIGDIDGDGWNDVAAGDMKDGGSFIAWFRNPADGSADWARTRLGEFPGVYPDRLDLADVDGDGRLDVVVSEENDGSSPNAEVMWYRQPDDPSSNDWSREVVVEQFTTNGMDVADADGDGDLDLVTGEHRGTRRVAIWEQIGVESGVVEWSEHVVDEGKESHLGARVHDLDGDGDLDIVSIGWDEPQFLHLWVND